MESGLLSTSYQWSRGLRERVKTGGFEISVSKTIAVPIGSYIRRRYYSKRMAEGKAVDH
jgi:hypothetical protein